jgi:ethanolamine utilization protein EutN
VIRGRVLGEVWATKKAPSLTGYRLKLVAVDGAEGPAESGRVVVAFDVLDARRGDAVMVSFGSGARNVLRPGAAENRDLICDCAISQIVDGTTSEP